MQQSRNCLTLINHSVDINYLLIQLVTAKLSKLEPISNSQKAKQYLESKDLFVYKAKQTLYEAAIFYFLF